MSLCHKLGRNIAQVVSVEGSPHITLESRYPGDFGKKKGGYLWCTSPSPIVGTHTGIFFFFFFFGGGGLSDPQNVQPKFLPKISHYFWLFFFTLFFSPPNIVITEKHWFYKGFSTINVMFCNFYGKNSVLNNIIFVEKTLPIIQDHFKVVQTNINEKIIPNLSPND